MRRRKMPAARNRKSITNDKLGFSPHGLGRLGYYKVDRRRRLASSLCFNHQYGITNNIIFNHNNDDDNDVHNIYEEAIYDSHTNHQNDKRSAKSN